MCWDITDNIPNRGLILKQLQKPPMKCSSFGYWEMMQHTHIKTNLYHINKNHTNSCSYEEILTVPELSQIQLSDLEIMIQFESSPFRGNTIRGYLHMPYATILSYLLYTDLGFTFRHTRCKTNVPCVFYVWRFWYVWIHILNSVAMLLHSNLVLLTATIHGWHP